MGLFGGGGAKKAAKKASAEVLKGQQQAMDLYRSRGAIPVGATEALAGLYGIPGYADTLDLVGQARRSPIYEAMTAQIDQSLSDEMMQTGRDASVGGFLRSGVLADALAKQRARSGVAKSQALSDVYQQQLAGVQGLSMRPDYTGEQAGLFQGMGQTKADEIMAIEQAKQNAKAGKMGMISGMLPGVGNLLGGGIPGLGAGEGGGGAGGMGNIMSLLGPAMMAFSDIRMKENVQYEGELFGHAWYSWDWNDKAKEYGFEGRGEGVMAHMVEKYAPEAVSGHDGYMVIDYGKLRAH